MITEGDLLSERYRIRKELGHGAMSISYEAVDEDSGKLHLVTLYYRAENVTSSRFEEMKRGWRINTDMFQDFHHPNLPSVEQVFEDNEQFVIICSYPPMDGISLSLKLSREGAQPMGLVIDWGKQLCSALHYLHTKNPPIIFRDLHPGNVQLMADGSLRLIDFGYARKISGKAQASNLKTSMLPGRAGYAAPEQFGSTGGTDARTDIYSLGVLIYYFATGSDPGEPPYEIFPSHKAGFHFSPARNPDTMMPKWLEKIIRKCVDKNPAKRYQNCMDVSYALDKGYRKYRNKSTAIPLALDNG